MTGTALIPTDGRQIADLVQDLRRAGHGYLPRWQPADGTPDGALIEIAARYLYAIVQRLNQAPLKNRLAFLDAIGVDLLPAQAARVPIVFHLSDRAESVRAPQGTRVAAPPPVDSTQQLVFETERTTDLTAGKLVQVVSLWPGRDQYIDHSAAVVAGTQFVPWELPALQDIPHHLYLRHDVLLALKGESRLSIRLDLTTVGNELLEVIWEYWDGSDWRGFEHAHPDCGDVVLTEDGTDGLRRSGTYKLVSECADAQPTAVDEITGYWLRGRLDETLPPDPERVLPEIDQIGIATTVTVALDYRTDLNAVPPPKQFRVTQIVSGLLPESVVASAQSQDPTQPFQPFGPAPQPGATFYVKSDEAFATPGAQINRQVDLLIAWERNTPNLPGVPIHRTTLSNIIEQVRWEYWNGTLWVFLAPTLTDGGDLFVGVSGQHVSPAHLAQIKLWTRLTFTVPPDIAKTKVNEEDGLWIRARLDLGDFAATLVPPKMHRHFQIGPLQVPVPPLVTHIRLGYTWTQGPFPPTTVLTYNDFRFADRTTEATVPGPTFQPYTPSVDTTPALYLGFDKKPPLGRIGILFDIQEDPADSLGPVLLWEYFDGVAWQKLSAEDGTHGLRIPEIAAITTESDDTAQVRFDTPLAPLKRWWVRARLAEDGPPGAPKINAVYPNAVWAVQHQTIADEPLGTSSGEAGQTFVFRQVPVLPDTQIAVREIAGRRANIEWRQLAMEAFGGDASRLQSLETDLLAEGPQTDIERAPILLRRDRLKRVTEVWISWSEQPKLFGSGPTDRHYVVDRARGRLAFGDGEHGKVPPAGAAIQARLYRAGGGRAGNAPAKAVAQLLGPAAGVESVENPLPAQGGADGEPLAQVAERGPSMLANRGRAVTPGDYEALAYEAAPDLGWVRAIPCRDHAGRVRPGWVTLLVVPDDDTTDRPWPSFGLRENIRIYVEGRAGADVAAADRVVVTGPDYFPIDVEATLAAVDPAESGAVADRARDALKQFFSPVRGGPNGRGWDLGRDVFVSDVASVLEHVPGLDYVRELALLANGVRLGERVDVPDGKVAAAGDLRLKV